MRLLPLACSARSRRGRGVRTSVCVARLATGESRVEASTASGKARLQARQEPGRGRRRERGGARARGSLLKARPLPCPTGWPPRLLARTDERTNGRRPTTRVEAPPQYRRCPHHARTHARKPALPFFFLTFPHYQSRASVPTPPPFHVSSFLLTTSSSSYSGPALRLDDTTTSPVSAPCSFASKRSGVSSC